MVNGKEKIISKFKNKLNMSNIGIILIILVLGVFNFIIGANEKGLRVLPISILLGLIILYLIVFKLKNKEKSIFFKNKVDYLVLGFIITTTFPLIFKTWASYSDTVEFILKYFFIYSVYVLARNVIKTKRQIETVIITVLISSLFSVVLQFDYMNLKILKDFMKWLDVTYSSGGFFSGIFGYPNAQAVYLALCLLLAMHRFKVNKNKVLKLIDILYIIFSLYVIWTTESKAVMVLLGITLFILFIIRFRKQILKHKFKILIGIILLIIFTIVFISVALNVSKPVSKTDGDMKQIIKYNFKKGQKYTLELELETIYLGDKKNEKDNNFTFRVSESGKYFIGVKLVEEDFGEFNGIYKVEFTPSIDTDFIKVTILNKNKGIIKINRCYINGKEHIINYKYISNELAYILSGYSMSGKSIPQRIQMYKDCIKMFKDSPIVGNGGDTWKNVSRAVAEYKGALKESHSYFFELLISYGIVGLSAYLVLIIYFFIKIFKQCIKNKEIRKEKLLIVLGLLILLLHSLIDFDMSFMLLQLITYICIAILLYDEQENITIFDVIKKNNNKITEKRVSKFNNIIELILILFLVFILSIYVRASISKYILSDIHQKHSVTPYIKKYYNEIIKQDIKNDKDGIELLEEIKDYMQKELYFTQNESYERLFTLIYKNIDNLTIGELENYLSFGIERVKNVRVKTPMYFDSVIQRTKNLANAVKNFEYYITNLKERNETISLEENEKILILKNANEQLKNIINNEYDINIRNLEDAHRNGYDRETRENLKQKYKNIISEIGVER